MNVIRKLTRPSILCADPGAADACDAVVAVQDSRHPHPFRPAAFVVQGTGHEYCPDTGNPSSYTGNLRSYTFSDTGNLRSYACSDTGNLRSYSYMLEAFSQPKAFYIGLFMDLDLIELLLRFWFMVKVVKI